MDNNKNYIPVIDLEANIVFPLPAIEKPLPDGKAEVGTSSRWAREDHVHPITISGDIPEKLSELENDTGFITNEYVDEAVAEKADIYYLPAIVKLSEVQVGDNLRGKTLTFPTDIVFDSSVGTFSINFTTPGIGTGGGSIIVGTLGVLKYTIQGSVGATDFATTNSWKMSSYTFPDSYDIIVSSRTETTLTNVIAQGTKYEEIVNINVEDVYKLAKENEKNITGNVKLASAATQLINSDVALKNGNKFLLEKQDETQAAGIFMGEYNETKTVSIDKLKVGDNVGGSTIIFDTSKNPIFKTTIPLAGLEFVEDGERTTPGKHWIVLYSGTTNQLFMAYGVVGGAEKGMIIYYNDSWSQPQIILDYNYIVTRNQLTDADCIDPTSPWNYSNGTSVNIITQYEQVEVGTESDPLCLNHSAKSPNGTVVGNNIIVNYKDENGVGHTDGVAYISDITGLQQSGLQKFSITDNADLNDCTEPGMYFINTTDYSNAPTEGSWLYMLVVSNGAAVTQTCWNGDTGKQYKRHKPDSQNWGAWVEMADESMIPEPSESLVIDVSQMFNINTGADVSAFLFKRNDETDKGLIKLHGFDNSNRTEDLTIVPVFGFGPQYDSYQAVRETSDGVTFTDYAIKLNKETDSEGSVVIPYGVKTFDVNYYLHIPTASYYITTDNVMHPFELENTPIENFCVNSTSPIIINGKTIVKTTIKEICFGDSYTSITNIGDRFLYICPNLTSVNLMGLSNVLNIGIYFIDSCSKLSLIDLSVLSNVTTIKDTFLTGSSLPAIDLTSLRNVTSIGLNFLSRSSNLTTIDLTPLSNVTTIGNNFMVDTALTTIDTSGLENVTTIGMNFLAKSSNLSSVNLRGLKNINNTKENFLSYCSKLTSIDLNGLDNVTTIGSGFLKGCSNLISINNSNLNNVTVINDSFLYDCTSLPAIDLSSLSRVTKIGNYFLYNCERLKSIQIKDVDWSTKTVSSSDSMFLVPNDSTCNLYADTAVLADNFKVIFSKTSDWTVTINT